MMHGSMLLISDEERGRYNRELLNAYLTAAPRPILSGSDYYEMRETLLERSRRFPELIDIDSIAADPIGIRKPLSKKQRTAARRRRQIAQASRKRNRR